MTFDDFGNRAMPSRSFPIQAAPHPNGGMGATGPSNTGGEILSVVDNVKYLVIQVIEHFISKP